MLTGDPQRGPLYAVYTYLEDFVGVRWWTSSAAYYPSRPLSDLPIANLRFAPRLKYREAYYLDGFDPLLKVRSKINYSSAARYEPATPVHPFIPPELGGNYRLYAYCFDGEGGAAYAADFFTAAGEKIEKSVAAGDREKVLRLTDAFPLYA